MAITVDWPTGVITVPRSYMIVVPSSIVNELRQLDSEQFRKDLRALEESEDGRVFPLIIRYEQSVTLGGSPYASRIRINPYYTVLFELLPMEDLYRVSLVSSNNNIADQTILNGVSIQPNNSAGLQNLNTILSASYNGEIVYDPSHPQAQAGAQIPIGTRSTPSNNLADTIALCALIGVNQIRIGSNVTIDTLDLSAGYNFTSDNPLATTVVLDPSADLTDCRFYGIRVTGTLDSNTMIERCSVLNLSYISGVIIESVLLGTITVAASSLAIIINCISNISAAWLSGTPKIDLSASGSVGLSGHEGDLIIQNYAGGGAVDLDMRAGTITIDSTVTDGTINLQGTCEHIDNSTGTAQLIAKTINEDLQTMNQGIQDASILVPHSEELD